MKPFVFILPFSCLFPASFADAPYPGSQWVNTLFLDDFTGAAGALPDSSQWILQTGTSYPGGPAQWGTSEIESYTNSASNIQQTGDGHLTITPQLSNGQWTSARMETQASDFVAPAGGMMRVEASVMAPPVSSSNGLGYWPAFWMLGEGIRQNVNSWPSIGEFDIMEIVNGGGNTGHGLHCGTDPGGPCNEPNGIYQFDNCPGSGCSGNYHTYTLIIDRSVSPEQMHYQIDSQTFFTISESQVDDSTWSSAVDQGHFIIANVAMGGALPNAISGQTTPTSATQAGIPMTIDYIAVWTT